jgi:transcriptional regulator with XRE-family HTH domain
MDYINRMGRASKEFTLTPALCRAARGLLNWTQEELAARSTVSRSTIRDYEGDRHGLHRSTAALLLRALQDGGVVFADIAGHGMGVCAASYKHPD